MTCRCVRSGMGEMIPMKYFENISKLSNFDQTGSDPTGTMEMFLMTYFSQKGAGGICHGYAYSCQRAILLLHR
jgi:hypothetical protein